MLEVDFVRPAPGILVDFWPESAEEYHERKGQVALEVLERVFAGNPDIKDASLFSQLLQDMFSHDDTAAPKDIVRFRRLGSQAFGIDMGKDFLVAPEDGSVRKSEELILPLHASTLIYAGLHYRSQATYYCTALVTTELEVIRDGEPPEKPLFVWIA